MSRLSDGRPSRASPRIAGFSWDGEDRSKHQAAGPEDIEGMTAFGRTSSYRMAFLNGLLFNVVNFAIVAWLFWRPQTRAPAGELLTAWRSKSNALL